MSSEFDWVEKATTRELVRLDYLISIRDLNFQYHFVRPLKRSRLNLRLCIKEFAKIYPETVRRSIEKIQQLQSQDEEAFKDSKMLYQRASFNVGAHVMLPITLYVNAILRRGVGVDLETRNALSLENVAGACDRHGLHAEALLPCHGYFKGKILAVTGSPEKHWTVTALVYLACADSCPAPVPGTSTHIIKMRCEQDYRKMVVLNPRVSRNNLRPKPCEYARIFRYQAGLPTSHMFVPFGACVPRHYLSHLPRDVFDMIQSFLVSPVQVSMKPNPLPCEVDPRTDRCVVDGCRLTKKHASFF